MKIKYKDLATGAFFKPANKYVYIKESDTKKISTANGFSLNMDPEALVTPLYNVPVAVRPYADTQTFIEYRNEIGQLHREDGPAVIDSDGNKIWWLNGTLHRTDGPAVEWPGGYKGWIVNGQHHRLDGPAVEYSDGSKEWWVNGLRHREDGPAVEWADGSKEWWVNGLRHREDGPAVDHADGYKEWRVNGLPHRLDGPACEWSDGDTAWFIEGIRITDPIEIEYLENGAHILQLAIADNL